MKHIIIWLDRIVHKHKALKRWKRIVTVMAALITFATTYALILPAITVEKNSAGDVGGMYLEREGPGDMLVENALAPPEEEILESSTGEEESAPAVDALKYFGSDYTVTLFYDDGWTQSGTGTVTGAGTVALPEPDLGELEEPSAAKLLTPNLKDSEDPESGDGTYTLTLSVTAPALSGQNQNKANIVVVYDSSNSMNEPDEYIPDNINGTYGTLYQLNGANGDQYDSDNYKGVYDIIQGNSIWDRINRTFVRYGGEYRNAANGNQLAQALKELFEQKPITNVAISDTLSDFVELYAKAPDFAVTKNGTMLTVTPGADGTNSVTNGNVQVGTIYWDSQTKEVNLIRAAEETVLRMRPEMKKIRDRQMPVSFLLVRSRGSAYLW